MISTTLYQLAFSCISFAFRCKVESWIDEMKKGEACMLRLMKLILIICFYIVLKGDDFFRTKRQLRRV